MPVITMKHCHAVAQRRYPSDSRFCRTESYARNGRCGRLLTLNIVEHVSQKRWLLYYWLTVPCERVNL